MASDKIASIILLGLLMAAPTFEPDFSQRLRAFMDAAPGTIKPTVGFMDQNTYKDFHRQATLNNRAAAELIGPPGQSPFQRGLASVLSYENPDTELWAKKNAVNYGLSLDDKNPWFVTRLGDKQQDPRRMGKVTQKDLFEAAWAKLFAGRTFASADDSNQRDFADPSFTSMQDLDGRPMTSAESRQHREMQETPENVARAQDQFINNSKRMIMDHENKPLADGKLSTVKAYRDGNHPDGSERWSIGFGTVSYEGEVITAQEAFDRFDDVYDEHAAPLLSGNAISNFHELPADIKTILIDFTYNMGPYTWDSWDETKGYIENWDFASAAEELRKDWNIPHTGEGKHPRVLQAMRVLNMWATRLALTSENTADIERARNEQR